MQKKNIYIYILQQFPWLSNSVQPEVVYTVHVELSGSVFDIGVDGKTTLTGPGGVTFTLHQTGLAESNPETGPIVKFLYSQ